MASLALGELNLRTRNTDNITVDALYLQEMRKKYDEEFSKKIDTSKNGRVNSTELEFYCQTMFDESNSSFNRTQQPGPHRWNIDIAGIDLTPKRMT